MGRGLTCRAAVAHGLIALGLELHPNRLSVTLAGLARLGLAPERVGTLAGAAPASAG
jgi:hypothetical protein